MPFGEFVPYGFHWFVKLMNMPLGSFAKGEQVTLVLGFLDAPQYRAAVQIACLDTAALQAATDRLCAAAPTGLTMKEGGTIRAECTAAANTDHPSPPDEPPPQAA